MAANEASGRPGRDDGGGYGADRSDAEGEDLDEDEYDVEHAPDDPENSLWDESLITLLIVGGVALLLGVVVIVHGAALLTGFAERLGRASGPLMIAYSIVMFLNQALLGAGMMDGGGSMGMSNGMGGSAMTAGMVALAVLILASGLIMSRDTPMSGGRGEM